jgi:hypothetical protein
MRPAHALPRITTSVAFAAAMLVAPAAWAQSEPAPVQTEDQALADEQMSAFVEPEMEESGSDSAILSSDSVSGLLDGRLAVANGARSWVDGGLGKTRFDGTADGDYQAYAVSVEADLIWTPRFSSAFSGNVSVAWQRDQEHAADLIEAFFNYLPISTGNVSFSARAGLMWPEISLEHSTGGAWSVVNTITPSTINSWVGEEVKVLGAEGTLHASLGAHQVAATAGIFGGNDTSGTLLSFRGWALHDEKATAFGHFPLPPLNPFIRLLQEDRTRSTIELDGRPGFYGRLEWRPPWPVGVALFYYDNRGDPQAFEPTGQWGWRTRFWNLGINADLDARTRLLAQGMAGSTIMGFEENGVPWVHTYFRSAYLLLAHQLTDRAQLTGRIEAFGTREHGSEMSPLESEDGWSSTVALRYDLTTNVTGFVEALNVRSTRGTRADLGLDPFQAQTVFQAALRVRL